ncbi:primosomal protein N' [Ramlibacter alkalitolerans]|uniref:Replication restart protein PriA n=1 Tax=Ramlibacter alkalitolerans TaxID=2039631 RepID=A0ABS1JVM0_9BURK|nr:primosomal protein N' [Ramlibacter alkalitolerans]MBL0428350.1 primosomal protein N' [Ramlibacter alkalitolerans]
MGELLHVVVPTPAHSTVGEPLSYLGEAPLAPGSLVRVPLGRREVCGVVWDPPPGNGTPVDAAQLRPVGAVLGGLPPLSAGWRQLVAFAAGYYQRSLGEVALAALPPQLRGLDAVQLARRLQRKAAPAAAAPRHVPPAPSDEQAQALAAIAAEPGPFLLFGATGSGKTEVYLRAVQALLARDPQAQALVLVPEINLTPQLQARFEERFGADTVVALHSGMTNPQRLKGWIAAHLGRARIVLGTRMAVFASLPTLGLIVVDEEHDPSYKQQEGARYSARDLAVYRGHAEGVKVVLGSATPSLESWQACDRGRYRCLEMPARIGAGALPTVRLVNMNHQPRGTLFSPPLLAAIGQRIARGEQSLVFLNRRGYAPVLACNACDWKSECSHCSAFRVFHKIDRTLRCHHCGFTERVPRACPQCGNVDVAPLGRGTERLEEQLVELLAQARRPDGEPARVARMDADSTRLKGALEEQLAQVHAGEVDVLVGTQMVTKGHDFRRITLVAAVNPDGALYSSDFRAPERLFSLLMQAAGRAGRDAARSAASEMWVQTFSPEHPMFAALKKHDYPAFAEQQLQERRQAAMPPFAFQALLRAEARTQEIAQAFLQSAADAGPGLDGSGHVVIYAPVPMTVQRVANVERAQLLLESGSRPALQAFLAAWQPVLQGLRVRGLIRWAIDVDPLVI